MGGGEGLAGEYRGGRGKKRGIGQREEKRERAETA